VKTALALTVFGGFLTALTFVVNDKLFFKLFTRHVSAGVLVLITASIALGNFWLMHRHWYHRLLQGSVAYGMELEQHIHALVPGIGTGLTETIKQHSKFTIRQTEVHSERKIDLFYGGLELVVIGLLVTILVAVRPDSKEAKSSATPQAEVTATTLRKP
jgi:hypothetical protein